MKKYKFFFGDTSIYSNWLIAPFHDFNNEGADTTYNCVEQYMMAQKARLFKDMETYNLIMDTSLPSEQKIMGRKVKNFDKDVWDAYAERIVYQGIYYKFSQNRHLLDAIMAEDCDLFVEAAPNDLIWGIGLNESKAKQIPETDWPGKNQLGKLLTQIRNFFRSYNEHTGLIGPPTSATV